MNNSNFSSVEIIPVLLTNKREVSGQIEFSWKEYLGENKFGRTSSGRLSGDTDQVQSCDNEPENIFKFPATTLPNISPPDINSEDFPYASFVVLHKFIDNSGCLIEKYSLLNPDIPSDGGGGPTPPQSPCNKTFRANINSSSPSQSSATKWTYQVSELELSSSTNNWQPKTNGYDGEAFNLLEINNTNNLAYGYEINPKDPPQLKNSPGFSIRPIPNNTIVNITTICSQNNNLSYYFSAVNPIDGFCQSGPLFNPV